MGNYISSISGNQAANYSEQTGTSTAPQAPAASRSYPAGQNALFDNMPVRASNASPPRPPQVAGSALQSESRADARTLRLSIAKEVLDDVRKTYYKSPNFKSSNKGHTRVDKALEQDRLNKAGGELNELYGKYRITPRNQHVELAKRARAHNCGELSILATDLLSRKKMIAVQIAIGGTAGTHAFSAILPPGHPGRMSGYDMGSDMDKWSDDIIICDPWSNIACPAPKFKELFYEKMNKWNEAGKLLITNNPTDGYKEFSANDSKWMDAVIAGKKEIAFVPANLGTY
ncbi:hypothetical protein KDW41_29895 [Burkholderia vietnamiensis]|nr:hypothetical protein [Burkholderia vietnamiensis]